MSMHREVLNNPRGSGFHEKAGTVKANVVAEVALAPLVLPRFHPHSWWAGAWPGARWGPH